MKKHLLSITALAAMLLGLASCTSDETVELNQGTPIRFNISAGASTRSVTDVTKNNIANIHVLMKSDAFTGGSYEAALNSNGSFADGQTHYWPQDATKDITFYALNIPFDMRTGLTFNPNNSNIDRESFGYENGHYLNYRSLKDDPTWIEFWFNPVSAYDLCFAYNKGKRADFENLEGVPLNFQHILSKVTIYVKNSNCNAVDIDCDHIDMGGFHYTGRFKMQDENGAVTAWEVYPGVTDGGGTADVKHILTDTYEKVTDALYIPQTTPTGSLLLFYVNIINKADGSIIFEGSDSDYLRISMENITFEMGKHYNIYVDLAKGGYTGYGEDTYNPLDPDDPKSEVHPMKFTIQVTGWDETPDDQELTVDNN